MSQENVEIVRAAVEAWNAGDMDAVRELYDPDVIVRAPEGWPEPGPFVGREAVMRQFEQLRETWDADTLEPIERLHRRRRPSCREADLARAQGTALSRTWSSRSSTRCARAGSSASEYFWDHAEALEAVGLSEQDAHADS